MDEAHAAPAWLRELRPERPGERSPASNRETLDHAIRVAGAEPVAWVVEVGHAMAQRIIAEMPQFGAGAEAFDILRMGTESSTLQFLVNLVTGVDERISTPEALDGVRDFVRRGIGMESVLRGTRLGHAGMSNAFLAACERLSEPDRRVEEMKQLTERLFDYMDAFSAELAGKYLDEQVRWSASDTAIRLEVVERILAGEEPPERVVSTLRYDLGANHIAVVAWSRDRALDVDAVDLQDACSELLGRLRCLHRLVIPVGAGRVWAWGTIGVAPVDVGPAIELLTLPSDVHMAVGTPGDGVHGFRSSHAEAVTVERLLPEIGPARPTTYRSVDLLSLLLADRARAIAFAARELGALAAGTAGIRDVRQTVAAFMDAQGSTQAAARQVLVARNTVSYRVRRAEEMLGRSIWERAAQLRAAIRIAEALPGEVAARLEQR